MPEQVDPPRPEAPWPDGFARIPDDDWTELPVEELALGYDTVERHGWYDNLDPTVDDLVSRIDDGAVVVDYSGGTGILIDRLVARLPETRFGVINVDSSPKFLRLSLEKFREVPRVGFRHLRWLRDERRLELLDEVLGAELLGRIGGLASTNAIHLYYDLPDTLRSWHRCLRDRGWVHVQSGNIGGDDRTPGTWIIDDTVHAIAEAAESICRTDPDFRAYRAALEDKQTMAVHHEIRNKYFVPVRPLGYYTDALGSTGFDVVDVERRAIEADVNEWFEFLAVYSDGILGWVGGTEKTDGRPPGDDDLQHRLALMRRAMEKVFDGKETFQAE